MKVNYTYISHFYMTTYDGLETWDGMKVQSVVLLSLLTPADLVQNWKLASPGVRCYPKETPDQLRKKEKKKKCNTHRRILSNTLNESMIWE